jgi:hypothetical protein
MGQDEDFRLLRTLADMHEQKGKPEIAESEEDSSARNGARREPLVHGPGEAQADLGRSSYAAPVGSDEHIAEVWSYDIEEMDQEDWESYLHEGMTDRLENDHPPSRRRPEGTK